MTGVDLFCGLGGFSYGMRAAKIRPVLGVDAWQDAVDAYAHNFPSAEAVRGDLFDPTFRKKLVERWIDRADVVTGGPPCQAWSVLNLYSELGYDDGPVEFVKLAVALRPRVIIMENVRQVGRRESTLGAMAEALKLGGYSFEHGTVDSSHHGVAQSRKRFYLVAVSAAASVAVLASLRRAPLVSPKDVLAPPAEESRLGRSTALKIGTSRRWKNSYRVLDEERATPAVTTRFNDPVSWPVRKGADGYYKVSIADALRLQGLPDDANLAKSKQSSCKLVGNAVVPAITRDILASLFSDATPKPKPWIA